MSNYLSLHCPAFDPGISKQQIALHNRMDDGSPLTPTTTHRPRLQRARNGSSASIMSSTSSIFSESVPPPMESYLFSPDFDDALYNFYINYAHHPTTTPFDTRYPPSGVLSQLSRLFADTYILNTETPLAIDTRPDINNDLLNGPTQTLLAVIRRRLIHLSMGSHGAFCQPVSLSRTASVASTMSISDTVDHHQLPPLQFPSQTQLIQPIQPPPPPRPQLSLANPRALRSPSISSTNNGITNMGSSSNNLQTLNSLSLSLKHPQFQGLFSPLDVHSPYEQNVPSPLAPTVPAVPGTAPSFESDDLYNATAARKRDSLKMKRR